MMMVIKSEEKRLLEALMDQEILTLKGFNFELTDNVGVIVSRGDHVRGFWRYQSGRFAWTPAGYYEATVHTKVIDDAVNFTMTFAEDRG